MDKDILFQQDSWMFSYRVGGLLFQDGKILLQRTVGDTAYAIPGGHVSFGEFSQETLAREFQEETGAAVNVGRLCFSVELFFRWKKPCHQINLYYLMELKNRNALPAVPFKVLDELGQEKINLEFCWVDLAELDQITVYPTCVQPYLKKLPDQVLHLQQNDLEG